MVTNNIKTPPLYGFCFEQLNYTIGRRFLQLLETSDLSAGVLFFDKIGIFKSILITLKMKKLNY
jgi:hypothetical protein